MTATDQSIWDRFPDYTEEELRDITAIAVQIMSESHQSLDQIPEDRKFLDRQLFGNTIVVVERGQPCT